jgi:lysophospholipase L1-like esterase
MKRRILALLVAGLFGLFAALCAAPAAEKPAKTPPKKRTAEDALTPTVKDPHRHKQFLSRTKQGPVGLLFLGDSITDFWPHGGKESWQKFAKYDPADFGISADRTEHVLWRLANGELDGIHPRVVVLMIGTNNIGHFAEEQPEWAAAGVKKIVETVHEKLPESRVLLLSVFPRDRKESASRKKVEAINAIIAKLDDGKKTRYLDVTAKFLDAQGEIPKDIMPDGLHPNAKGYDLWYEAMRPLLEEMIGESLSAQMARLRESGFPVANYHVHLKGGLTLEQALEQSAKTGIKYGVALNCGVGFPTTNDAALEPFWKSMQGKPALAGAQAEGREWPKLFSKEAMARFDYIFTDAMTVVDHRGHRARLWIKDEVDIPDKQAFMDLLVRTTVEILDKEPIDIYANPTYLPEVVAKEYDQLWTPERVRRVIEAAARNGVAIEISSGLRLPKRDFIRQAKQAGVKFTFGTNNTGPDIGSLEYSLRMVTECALTPQDMWSPKPDGKKPVQVKK